MRACSWHPSCAPPRSLHTLRECGSGTPGRDRVLTAADCARFGSVSRLSAAMVAHRARVAHAMSQPQGTCTVGSIDRPARHHVQLWRLPRSPFPDLKLAACQAEPQGVLAELDSHAGARSWQCLLPSISGGGSWHGWELATLDRRLPSPSGLGLWCESNCTTRRGAGRVASFAYL